MIISLVSLLLFFFFFFFSLLSLTARANSGPALGALIYISPQKLTRSSQYLLVGRVCSSLVGKSEAKTLLLYYIYLFYSYRFTHMCIHIWRYTINYNIPETWSRRFPAGIFCTVTSKTINCLVQTGNLFLLKLCLSADMAHKSVANTWDVVSLHGRSNFIEIMLTIYINICMYIYCTHTY